jgi:hypothetical protein
MAHALAKPPSDADFRHAILIRLVAPHRRGVNAPAFRSSREREGWQGLTREIVTTSPMTVVPIGGRRHRGRRLHRLPRRFLQCLRRPEDLVQEHRLSERSPRSKCLPQSRAAPALAPERRPLRLARRPAIPPGTSSFHVSLHGASPFRECLLCDVAPVYAVSSPWARARRIVVSAWTFSIR